MENIKGEGKGLKKEGAYSLSSPEKGGGGGGGGVFGGGVLIRGRGLFERGA